jgi:16S rRNA G966 N2-methylase RsmD
LSIFASYICISICKEKIVTGGGKENKKKKKGNKKRKLGKIRIADRAKDADRDAPVDFPYRSTFMPPVSDMFNRLKVIAETPPHDWERKTDTTIAVVHRKFPEDYEATDSITDHFVEPVRIACRERGKLSPAAAWVEMRDSGRKLPVDDRARRELVYNTTRGCNLFNGALAAYLAGRFGGNGCDILDCTAGWGDRLIAAHAAGARSYTGWDTNPDLQAVYKKIGDTFKNETKWRVTLGPFEEEAERFKPGGNLASRFDVAFVCPPYFDIEVYQGKQTSTELHDTEQRWYDEFYIPTVRAAAGGIRPGGYIMAYVMPGRMYQSANNVLLAAGYVYCGAVEFKQIVTDVNTTHRDTFIWRKKKQ